MISALEVRKMWRSHGERSEGGWGWPQKAMGIVDSKAWPRDANERERWWECSHVKEFSRENRIATMENGSRGSDLWIVSRVASAPNPSNPRKPGISHESIILDPFLKFQSEIGEWECRLWRDVRTSKQNVLRRARDIRLREDDSTDSYWFRSQGGELRLFMFPRTMRVKRMPIDPRHLSDRNFLQLLLTLWQLSLISIKFKAVFIGKPHFGKPMTHFLHSCWFEGVLTSISIIKVHLN